MPVRRSRSELECSPGVKPTYDSTRCAEANRLGSSIAAKKRTAVTGPTPGTVISLWQTTCAEAIAVCVIAMFRSTVSDARPLATPLARDSGHLEYEAASASGTGIVSARAMIESADEFIRLRTSSLKEEYDRAAHDEAAQDVWWEVVRKFPDMKFWVVHNKTVPLEILEFLSTDQEASVRGAVARKRKASPKILERLAHDAVGSVRHGVACNANAPKHVLQMLANDSWETVAATAKQRLSELDR
jgi:hypothetical protein